VLLLSLEVGGGSRFAANRSALTADAPASGAVWLGALWRVAPWIAVGGRIGGGGLPTRSQDTEGVGVATAMWQTRLLFPLSRVDLWLDLALGFGALTQAVDFTNTQRVSQLGPALGVGVGADVFLRPDLSLGLGWRLLRPYPALHCLGSDCSPADEGLDPGLLWWVTVRLTYHFPLGGEPASP
jgi:hypothetical protein